jgi:hypothetical protein
MRRWLENRLARLLATAYLAARARAIAAVPHDELTCGAKSGSGPGRHRASPSRNAKHQLVERKIYAAPLEQPERNNA